jgi:hypothetical protein
MQSDSKGFLVADRAVDGRELSQGISGIKHDTTAILNWLKSQARSGVLQRARVSGTTASAPRARDELGRFVSGKPTADLTKAVNSLTKQQAAQESVKKREEIATRSRSGNNQERDGRGRFGSGSSESESKGDSATSRIIGALKSAVKGNVPQNLDKVDPAIDAARELSSLFGGPMRAAGEIGKSVMGRGFVGGEKEKPARWYRRMWGEMRNTRKEQKEFSKAETKAIKDIKPGGGGSTEKESFFGTFFGSLLGRFAPLLLSGIGAVATGIGAVVTAIFSPIGLAISAAAVAAWGIFTEDGRKFFAGISEKFIALWSPISDYLKEKLGISVDAVVKAGNAVNNAIKNATGVDIKETAKGAKDWVLGKTSQLFESGKKGGAGTISRGNGDAGGISYGTYQLSSAKGTLQEFLSNTKYGKNFEGLTPGSKAFNTKWKALAAQDGEFGQAQHDFIKRTHFDRQMAKLQKGGMDLSGRGAAVQDAIWSTSTQFGGNTSLIMKALKGKNVSAMSDAEIVSAIQDYKTANNASLFRSSDDKTRAGTLARAAAEKNALLSMANGVSAPGLSAPSKVPSISVPSPTAPQPAARGDVAIPLSSKAPIEVTLTNEQLANQDVRDRRLAQIATGNSN